MGQLYVKGKEDMANESVPSVKVAVSIEGTSIAVFSFWKLTRSTADWEVTAALVDGLTAKAVRSCLLAAIAEIDHAHWEAGDGVFEELNPPRTEQLPWEGQ